MPRVLTDRAAEGITGSTLPPDPGRVAQCRNAQKNTPARKVIAFSLSVVPPVMAIGVSKSVWV